MSTTVRRFLHAAAVMTACVTMIAVPLVGAGSASAAPASLTKATCTAQGGTFTRSQGVKTCTTENPSPSCDNYSGLYVEQPAVTEGASGYFGTYTANLCYTTTTVQTQKGTKPITSTSSTRLTSRIVLSYDTCGYYDSSSFSSSGGEVFECVDAGLYPQTFFS